MAEEKYTTSFDDTNASLNYDEKFNEINNETYFDDDINFHEREQHFKQIQEAVKEVQALQNKIFLSQNNELNDLNNANYDNYMSVLKSFKSKNEKETWFTDSMYQLNKKLDDLSELSIQNIEKKII